jgi:putative ABC transport system substrate-binding protein
VHDVATLARQRSRRRLLTTCLALAGLGMMSGCQAPRLPWQGPHIPRIGFLAVGSREGRAPLIAGLIRGLGEHGYEEGRNILIEYRFSEDGNERLPALAAELLALPVELIVASGTPASFAAVEATRTVPIVMGSLAADPVATGLIKSLAHPGGNVTGISQFSAQLVGKRLELLKEIVPGLARVAVLHNPPNPAYGPILQALDAAAPTLSLQVVRVVARVPEELPSVYEAAVGQGAGALVVPGDPLTTNRPGVVAALERTYRLPTMMEFREFPEAGGLLSFGSNLFDNYRRAAAFVSKILNGANPGDLPMEQPVTFDLVVNLATARALGLSIPHSVQQQASELIQ